MEPPDQVMTIRIGASELGCKAVSAQRRISMKDQLRRWEVLKGTDESGKWFDCLNPANVNGMDERSREKKEISLGVWWR